MKTTPTLLIRESISEVMKRGIKRKNDESPDKGTKVDEVCRDRENNEKCGIISKNEKSNLVELDSARLRLLEAIKSGNVENVTSLLKEIAYDPERENDENFEVPVTHKKNIEEKLDWLLNGTVVNFSYAYTIFGEKVREAPLHVACREGHVAIVRLLLERGANVHCYCFRERGAILCNCLEGIPLHEACREGHVEVARLLLNMGADIEQQRFSSDRTALFEACERGHVDVVRFLLDRGARIHHQPQHGEFCCFSTGKTVLHLTCARGNLEMTQLLLDKGGADIINNQDKKGKTPLHVACREGHVHIVGLLLEKKAIINKCDKDCNTPLDEAICLAKEPSLSIVKMLVRRGASFFNFYQCRKDIAEWLKLAGEVLTTPLHFACDAGDIREVRRLLTLDDVTNIHIRSALRVVTSDAVASLMNNACQPWNLDPNISCTFPASFQRGVGALRSVLSDQRFLATAANNVILLELVLSFCDRTWFKIDYWWERGRRGCYLDEEDDPKSVLIQWESNTKSARSRMTRF